MQFAILNKGFQIAIYLDSFAFLPEYPKKFLENSALIYSKLWLLNFNYIHKSPQGSKLKHAHDVKLKSPYETSTGFSGDTSYLKVYIHQHYQFSYPEIIFFFRILE